MVSSTPLSLMSMECPHLVLVIIIIIIIIITVLIWLLCMTRMNRRKADFKFVYKFLEDDL
jgi:hypothetical protein